MNNVLHSLAGGLTLFVLTLSSAWAEETYKLDIADQELSSALKAFAEQSGLQVVYFADLAAGKQAKGVHGTYSADQALSELLDDTDLTYSTVDDRTYSISEAAATEGAGGDSDPGNGRTAGETPRPVRMTQAQTSAERNQTSGRTETDSDNDEIKRSIEEIIVTGTHIRGIAPESSPVRIFTREDIQSSGLATARDFIRVLPQNFGGGADESFVTAPGNTQAGFNDSMGTGINLRGLGAGSTLVLIDGRRIAPSSDIGGFTDISMIPASALERVEVLTDGASSIYGGDAVAGVVNFVLRDDFDGVEASLRYGTVTDGNLDEYTGSITAGRTWESGNGLLIYEYHQRDNLDISERDFGDASFSPNDLLPRQARNSILASVSQDVSPAIEIGADLFYSVRDARRFSTGLSGVVTGVTFIESSTAETLNVSASMRRQFSANWVLELDGNYSEATTDAENLDTSDNSVFSRANAADYAGIDAMISGPILPLPGGTIRVAAGSHYRQENFKNVAANDVFRSGKREVYAVYGEAFVPLVGTENAIPGIERLELNLSGRFEDYSDFGSDSNPKLGVLWAPVEDFHIRGSFGTSFKPPTVGQTGALDRSGVVVPYGVILNIFGATPADPFLESATLINVGGVANDLDAETSEAVTIGFDYEYEDGGREFSFSTTYFDIEFEDRLGRTPVPAGQSSFLVPNIAFTNPGLFPPGTVVFLPTDEQIGDLLASLEREVIEVLGGQVEDVNLISFANVTRNLTLSRVTGTDFDATYTVPMRTSELTFGVAGTYLIDLSEQASPTTESVELHNTLYNPAELRLRGRVGYSSGGFNASAFVNHTGDYRTDNSESSVEVDAWTTVDLSLAYDFQPESSDSFLTRTSLRLSVINLFDEDPPAAPTLASARIIGFDPTNASPLGRFIALEASKRF